ALIRIGTPADALTLRKRSGPSGQAWEGRRKLGQPTSVGDAQSPAKASMKALKRQLWMQSLPSSSGVNSYHTVGPGRDSQTSISDSGVAPLVSRDSVKGRLRTTVALAQSSFAGRACAPERAPRRDARTSRTGPS